MGSSNAEITATGDLEAQPRRRNWFSRRKHRRHWFIHHKHMLRADQKKEVNSLGYFILKVPDYYRQPRKEFTPVGWQFGLHNRKILDSSESEALKLSIAVQCGLVGAQWDDFCNAVVDDPKAMLICYGLQEVGTTWSDEQVKHVLALDALFLAYFMDTKFPVNEGQLWVSGEHSFHPSENNVYCPRYSNWVSMVCFDLGRVENQIPYVLIQRAIEYIFQHKNKRICDAKYLEEGLKYASIEACHGFMDISGKAFTWEYPCPLTEKKNILAAAYGAICGCATESMKTDWTLKSQKSVPSATTLKHAGIKIVAVDGPLCTMCYEKKCLFLPKMSIYDHTVSLIRNMAWFELTCTDDACLFRDYIGFMRDLIQVPTDLDLLIERGVILNYCGIKTFGKWRALEEGLVEGRTSKHHHTMKEDIMRRCNMRRYRLWSEFRIVFCSRPWLALSTAAAVLVILCTLIQVYVAVIGSHEMKPQFP